MIKYVYTDTLPDVSKESDEMFDFDWAGLHAMGDKYDIEPLAADVEQALLSVLCAETAVKILKIAGNINSNDRLYQHVAMYLEDRSQLIVKCLYGQGQNTLLLVKDVIDTCMYLSSTTTAPCVAIPCYHYPLSPIVLYSLLPPSPIPFTMTQFPPTTG